MVWAYGNIWCTGHAWTPESNLFVAGSGPINTPYGAGYVSPPYSIARFTADANGSTGTFHKVGGSASGIPIWFHGVDFQPGILFKPPSPNSAVGPAFPAVRACWQGLFSTLNHDFQVL